MQLLPGSNLRVSWYLAVGIHILVSIVFGSLGFLLFLGMRGELEIPQVLNLHIVQLPLYSLAILAAITTSLLVFHHLLRYYELKVDIWELLLFVLPPAVVGARLYHVLTDFPLYQNDFWSIFAVSAGGVGIIGAILGGLFGLWLFARYHKHNLLQLVSLSVVVLPLGQAIGRLGNFFNQELYGLPTDLPWGLYVEPAKRVAELTSEMYFHPLFLYEILGNLFLFLFLFITLRFADTNLWRWRRVHLYLLGYAILRFSLDFLRVEGKAGVLGLSWAQWIAIVVVVAIFAHAILYRSQNKMSRSHHKIP